MRFLFGTRDTAAEAVALLVDVTRADLAELRRCARCGNHAASASRLHRILGGLGALGHSPLIDDGRTLLAAMRAGDMTTDGPALRRYAARLETLLGRLCARFPRDAAPAIDHGRDCEWRNAAQYPDRRAAAPYHAPA